MFTGTTATLVVDHDLYLFNKLYHNYINNNNNNNNNK